MALQLPPDWDRYPELVQALQVLVEGAVRSRRGSRDPCEPEQIEGVPPGERPVSSVVRRYEPSAGA